jgi:hypothetical protein
MKLRNLRVIIEEGKPGKKIREIYMRKKPQTGASLLIRFQVKVP